MAVDREVEASALVLREVHCGLLRAIEGAGLKRDAAPPPAANSSSLPEAGGSQAQWSERVVNAVLSAAEPVGQEAWVGPSPESSVGGSCIFPFPLSGNLPMKPCHSWRFIRS